MAIAKKKTGKKNPFGGMTVRPDAVLGKVIGMEIIIFVKSVLSFKSSITVWCIFNLRREILRPDLAKYSALKES